MSEHSRSGGAVPRLGPRKNPRQERSQQTLDVILEGALQQLERGPEGAPAAMSTTRIAERAGVSVGSLYQYFKGKDALLALLIRRFVQKRFKEIEARLREVEPLPLEAAALAFAEALIELELKNLKVANQLLQWFTRAGDLSLVEQVDREAEQAIQSCLRRIAAKTRPLDAEFASFVLFNMVRAFLSACAYRDAGLLRRPETRDELARVLLGYLTPRL